MKSFLVRTGFGSLSALVTLIVVGYFVGPSQKALALSVHESAGTSVIYGKVTSDSGGPVSGVRVDVSTLSRHSSEVDDEEVYTSIDGTYRISRNLPTGRYVVRMVDSAQHVSADIRLTIHKFRAYRVSGRIFTEGGFHFYLPIFSY